MTAPATLLPPGYLRTHGASIVGPDGSAVRLAGVNWYGMECAAMVPGGLDLRTLDELCSLVVELGFNHLRLPFCDEAVLRNPRLHDGLATMPALRGATALEVMDAVVDAARRHRLKVVLDDHRCDPGWSAQENGLWYTPRCTPRMWMEALTLVASRYAGDDTVVGIDLRNEPGSPAPDGSAPPRNGGAVWGQADWPWSRHPRDWAAAAEAAGNAVLACNPDLLIVVEGVRRDPAGPVFGGTRRLYWPGGNLTGVRQRGGRRLRARPLTLDIPARLVYSVHDYGPAMHPGLPWCQPGTTALSAAACRAVWEQTWGFVVRGDIAPIYVGELGTPTGAGPEASAATEDILARSEAQESWLTYLVDYIAELGASWAYWPLNGRNSPGGGRDPSRPEAYGVLTPDWSTAKNPRLMTTLAAIQGLPRPRSGGA